jgi:hypothetical protein
MLAYFIDGTYMSMESFNDRKKDSGYTALLENQEEAMSSSHQMKRFFRKLMNNNIGNKIYRKILQKLFLWRLQKVTNEIKERLNIYRLWELCRMQQAIQV